MTETISFHDLRGTDTIPAALLRRTETDLSAIIEQVKPIIEAVRTEGDAALHRFARAFDGVQAEHMELRASEQEIEAAYAQLRPGDDRDAEIRHRQYPPLP